MFLGEVVGVYYPNYNSPSQDLEKEAHLKKTQWEYVDFEQIQKLAAEEREKKAQLAKLKESIFSAKGFSFDGPAEADE